MRIELMAKVVDGKKVPDGMEVTRSGPRQNFSPGLIERGVAEGWLSMGKGRIVLHDRRGDIVYTIKRVPGRYPNKELPAGYEVINHYECIKE